GAHVVTEADRQAGRLLDERAHGQVDPVEVLGAQDDAGLLVHGAGHREPDGRDRPPGGDAPADVRDRGEHRGERRLRALGGARRRDLLQEHAVRVDERGLDVGAPDVERDDDGALAREGPGPVAVVGLAAHDAVVSRMIERVRWRGASGSRPLLSAFATASRWRRTSVTCGSSSNRTAKAPVRSTSAPRPGTSSPRRYTTLVSS